MIQGIGEAVTATLHGIEAEVVQVETDIGGAVPNFLILGLGDKAVQECRDRIRSAAKAVQLPLPPHRITVNLAPANRPKSGTHFDLPILMSILDKQGLVIGSERCFFAAELGLDGSLKPVRGILPMLLAAQQSGITDAVVALENLEEAQLVPAFNVSGYHHVSEVLNDFLSDPSIQIDTTSFNTRIGQPKSTVTRQKEGLPNLADVAGQAQARFALEICAAGRHHMLMVGPPGAGKTMLAQSLPSILPKLSPEEATNATAIASLWKKEGSITTLKTRPEFVNPHHSASTSAIVGSGRPNAAPGAVTQAHHGVLFLDEAPEFRKDALESLRQPLESREVTIMRASGVIKYPCDFQLIMAANPCPCGYNPGSRCRCTPHQQHRYSNRISGPLLDRIDLQIRVEPVGAKSLSNEKRGESSEEVSLRVLEARRRQHLRLSEYGLSLNSQMSMHLASKTLRLKSETRRTLDKFLERNLITARGYLRIIRLAWTIADVIHLDKPDSDCVDAAYSLRLNF